MGKEELEKNKKQLINLIEDFFDNNFIKKHLNEK